MPADPDVTRLDLERLALGRLPTDEAAALRRRAEVDPELSLRVTRVGAELHEAAVDLPPLRLPEVHPSLGERLRRWWLAPTLALVAVAAALLTLRPSPEPQPAVFRGALDLELTRVRLGQAQPQGAVVEAAAGDRLQFVVTAPTDGWIAVFDIQDDGAISTWLPPTEQAALTPAEGAVLLDDYAGSERVFFVASTTPLDEDDVVRALERAFDTPLVALDRLPLPDAVSQRSVLLVKP